MNMGRPSGAALRFFSPLRGRYIRTVPPSLFRSFRPCSVLLRLFRQKAPCGVLLYRARFCSVSPAILYTVQSFMGSAPRER